MQRRWLTYTTRLCLPVILSAMIVFAIHAQAPTVTPIAMPSSAPTYLVQRGTVQQTLNFTGRWLPRDQQKLSFEIPGMIRNVFVSRNDAVVTGELLAEYQVDDLQSQLDEQRNNLQQVLNNNSSSFNTYDATRAQFDLNNALLELGRTEDSLPWADVSQARIELFDAQVELEDARRVYRNTIGDPRNSATNVDRAYENMKAAERAVALAQTYYWEAAQFYNVYQYRIEQAKNNVAREQFDLASVTQGGTSSERVDQINDIQLQIDQLEQQIRQAKLTAPFDGIVLEVNIEAGQSVDAFQSVMTLALPQPLEVVSTLAFSDTQLLGVGDIGVCQVQNYPETAVQCIIRQVPLSESEVDQTTRVAASLENVPSGQIIEVRMPIDAREQVLWLPPEAIRTFQNRTFVVVQTATGEQVVDITLGLRTDERVEILNGLTEGDVVIGQ